MLPHTDGLLLVQSTVSHGTTGVGLASALVTSIGWAGVHPGLAPVIAAGVAGLAVAWLERRRSARMKTTGSRSLGPTPLEVPTEVRRAPAARWRVSTRTGRPSLTWE